jgi:hypothetical protein
LEGKEYKMDEKKTNKKPVFLIDASTLQLMFEESKNEKSVELMSKLKEIKDGGKPLDVIIPMNQLLRAIWLSNPEAKIKNIQKVLSFSEIIPTREDFKKEQEVMEETLKLLGSYLEQNKKQNGKL